MAKHILTTVAILMLLIAPVIAHPDDDDAPTTRSAAAIQAGADMADAATKFFASLNADQQAKTMFDFVNPERLNWNYIPMPRKGIPWKEMSDPQRELARTLLKSGLSAGGYDKAEAIMHQLEPILHANDPAFDSALYYVTIFGKPDVHGTWGWRFEGHHISLNFTIVDGVAVSGSPQFFGANPANVESGPSKGLRVLGVEEDMGRQLVKSLDEEQQKLGILSKEAPHEITTGNERQINPKAPTGIPAEKLNDNQKAILHKLIDEYAHRLRPALADEDLRKIETAGFEKVCFAWLGGVEPGDGHYYRIQGPTFMIEYDNTQNHANHIHTVWRDPANDFGEDFLKEHYAEHHHDHD